MNLKKFYTLSSNNQNQERGILKTSITISVTLSVLVCFTVLALILFLNYHHAQVTSGSSVDISVPWRCITDQDSSFSTDWLGLISQSVPVALITCFILFLAIFLYQKAWMSDSRSTKTRRIYFLITASICLSVFLYVLFVLIQAISSWNGPTNGFAGSIVGYIFYFPHTLAEYYSNPFFIGTMFSGGGFDCNTYTSVVKTHLNLQSPSFVLWNIFLGFFTIYFLESIFFLVMKRFRKVVETNN